MTELRPTILVIEDEPEIRRFLRTSLGAEGYRVVEADTGERGVIDAGTHKPDLAIVDLGLPDVHGTEVIRYAARHLPECDVMVITMFADERNVLASIEAGATGYVLKDCSDADLVARVLELRAGGSPMSPGIARIVLNQMRLGTGGATVAGRRGTVAAEGAQSSLTTRETDVLRLLSRGYTYSEVGDRLGISVHTVTSHIKNSYRKLAVHSGAAAVTRAAELGLLRPGEGNGPTR